jgi:ectoine hydroxylase-related dioxygenase (phytanoyl-CoA dioxygenase family)
MELGDATQAWRTDGFVIVPGYLSADDLAPALDELSLLFPTATGFHEGSDPRRQRFLDDEFAGIDTFPFASVQLSLLAVHARIVDLVEALLGTEDVRIYSAEAWAKYTGAADYDQRLHRDFLNHTILVPTEASEYQQVELFVYLVEVPDDLGPPHLVPHVHTADLPALPNWHPRADTGPTDDMFVATAGRPDLYDAEVSAAGPAGTVVAFTPNTLHRGTAVTRPGGARYSMHLSFRVAAAEWAQRQAWADRSHEPAWYRFVEQATPRQLTLLGFPPPGHPFWTPETLAGVALRYPRLDLTSSMGADGL